MVIEGTEIVGLVERKLSVSPQEHAR